MAVKIGSARIDENGKARGGKPGDQTGNEVSVQNWYLHSKGWRVFRAKSAAAAEKIARAMERACANPNIGYDQGGRLTLYNAARLVGYDPGAVASPVETDCSALVRVCCAYAGITLPDFTTPSQPKVMLASGAFTELAKDKYTRSSQYLRRGDVLVTPVQGHTVVVLTDGPKAEAAPAQLGERILRKGDKGEDVRALQEALNKVQAAGLATDADFGRLTDAAVRSFQGAHSLVVDGEYGPKSHAAMSAALAATKRHVRVTGAAVNVRTAPSTASGQILGVVHKGDLLAYGGEVSADGWLLVEYKSAGGVVAGNAWISGRYAEVVE